MDFCSAERLSLPARYRVRPIAPLTLVNVWRHENMTSQHFQLSTLNLARNECHGFFLFANVTPSNDPGSL
jgi:hypothetical protein